MGRLFFLRILIHFNNILREYEYTILQFSWKYLLLSLDNLFDIYFICIIFYKNLSKVEKYTGNLFHICYYDIKIMLKLIIVMQHICIVIHFVILWKEARYSEILIIDIADYEIDEKRGWVRTSMIFRVRADQWNFWKALACTRRIGLYGRSRNSRLLRGMRNTQSDHLVNLFRLIANE